MMRNIKVPNFAGKRHIVKTITFVFRILREASKKHLTITVIGSIFVGISPVMGAYTGKYLIDSLAVSEIQFQQVIILVAFQAALAVMVLLNRDFLDYSQEVLRKRSAQNLSTAVLTHVSKMDLDFFESAENHNLLTKAVNEIQFRPTAMINSILSLAQSSVTVLGFLVVLIYQPLIIVVILLSVISLVKVYNAAGERNYNVYDFTTVLGRRAFYYEQLLSRADNAQEVQLYGIAPIILKKHKEQMSEIVTQQLSALKINIKSIVLAQIMSTSVTYAAIIYITTQVAQKAISIGEYTLYVAAIATIRALGNQIISEIGQIHEHILFFNNINILLATNPQITSPIFPSSINLPIHSGFVIKNLTFLYPGTSKHVFKDFNLDLKVDVPTAIVGLNGSGKTTLIKLLMRLYDPTDGDIFLDGVNIKEYDLIKYRELFSAILQNFTKYHLSLLENITLGFDDVKVNHPKLANAVEAASLRGLIDELPMHWNTNLGRQYVSDGVELSEGQWQRVALGRALYRDAPVFILDEPTAAVDVNSEAHLIEIYEQITQNKVSILITHRFNSVKNIKRIIVMEDGKIVEDGSHLDLMNLRGLYHDMYTLQASGYAHDG